MSNILNFDEINKFYRATDEAIELLSNKAAKRFLDCKAKLGRDGFEDYLVYKTVMALYEDLTDDNKKTFLNLANRVYKRTVPHGDKAPGTRWIEGILEDPCPVTKYVYVNEADRKAERAVEAINAAHNRKEKLDELMKAARYWSAQTRYYCDFITDEATQKAYKDAGIKKVQWITQRDGRVCDDCHERDGMVYDIDKIPPKTHPNCRCIIKPYLK